MVIRNESSGRGLEVEVKAVVEGVRLAWDLSLKKIVLKSDLQTMVNALRMLNLSPSSILKVVEGTMMELCCFDEWEAFYTCSGNSTAHVLARQAKLVNEYIIWVEDTPPLIATQVQHNVHCLNSCLV